MNEYKKALSRQERIKCAYLHCVRNVPMQDLAIAFEVNIGRVSEAVAAIKTAAENPIGFDDTEHLAAVYLLQQANHRRQPAELERMFDMPKNKEAS
jgi:hypothetical protein